MSARRTFLKRSLLVATAMGAQSFRGATLAACGSNTLTAPVSSTFHLGLVTYNLASDWDIPTIIKNCEAAGFEGVELRTSLKHGVEISLPNEDRIEVKKIFGDSRVRLVSLGPACEFQSPDGSLVIRNIEETRR